MTNEHLSFSLPHWRGSVILVVTALKTFRSAFSDCSKQYLVLMLAILLFQYEPSTGFINGGAEGTDGSKVNFANSRIIILKALIISAYES